MKKYGLELRVPTSRQKQPPTRPPLPETASIFRDDDEDDVEREISRQAAKNKALKDIEEQHKKALEQDPSVFAYDEVYDDMKQKEAVPRTQDRVERKSRYIEQLKKKAEERQRAQDIIYERKLAKERSKDEHLYADKDKFITSGYKRKLAEQAKWLEEERLRELQEEKEDVTKKTDISDFYFNIGRNVAYGARELEERKAKELAEARKAEKLEEEKKRDMLEKDQSSLSLSPGESSRKREHLDKTSPPSRRSAKPSEPKPDTKKPKPDSKKPVGEENSSAKEQSSDQPKPDHHKRAEDAIAAAKERFLARKKAKE